MPSGSASPKFPVASAPNALHSEEGGAPHGVQVFELPFAVSKVHQDADPDSTPQMPLFMGDLSAGFVSQPQPTSSPAIDDGEVSVVSATGFQSTQKIRGRPKSGADEKSKLKGPRSRPAKNVGGDADSLQGAPVKQGAKQLQKKTK